MTNQKKTLKNLSINYLTFDYVTKPLFNLLYIKKTKQTVFLVGTDSRYKFK